MLRRKQLDFLLAALWRSDEERHEQEGVHRGAVVTPGEEKKTRQRRKRKKNPNSDLAFGKNLQRYWFH